MRDDRMPKKNVGKKVNDWMSEQSGVRLHRVESERQLLGRD